MWENIWNKQIKVLGLSPDKARQSIRAQWMAADACLLDAAQFSVSLALWSNETFGKLLPLLETVKTNKQWFLELRPSLGHSSLLRASISFPSQCFCVGPQIQPQKKWISFHLGTLSVSLSLFLSFICLLLVICQAGSPFTIFYVHSFSSESHREFYAFILILGKG